MFLTAADSCEGVRQRRTASTGRKQTLESAPAVEIVLRAVLRGLNPSRGSFTTSVGVVTAPSAVSLAASSGTGRR